MAGAQTKARTPGSASCPATNMPGQFLSFFVVLLSITKEAGQDQSPSSLLVYSSTTSPLLKQVKVVFTTWPERLLCPPPEGMSPMSSPPPLCLHGAPLHLSLLVSIRQSLPFPAYRKPQADTQP